jgi:hypothetical protein
MPPSKQIIYVDTNVIIEATRTGCWKAILNKFDVRTVETVKKEALRVPADKSQYVPIDAELITKHVNVEKPGAADVLMASTRASGIVALDAGERDLLAHVAAKTKDAWLITTADRAAVKTACALKLDGRLISLEELASQCGQKPKLKEWFQKKWLSNVRSEFLLDSL